MNTITTENEMPMPNTKPGQELAKIRIARGLSSEYVATKLHLRVKIIELLEADNYQELPDSVFVKGYFRAYSKLLGIDPLPLIEIYNQCFVVERKTDKALWQSKRRDFNRTERIVRFATAIFGLIVFSAVAIWWNNSKEHQKFFAVTTQNVSLKQSSDQEIRLTDLSKMRSLLASDGHSVMQNQSLLPEKQTAISLKNNGDTQ